MPDHAALKLHTHVFHPGTSGRTFLLLHGTGGDEHDLIPLARHVDADAAILSPRGNVLERGAPRFFRRLAEGVFDLDDLRLRVAQLRDWLGAAIERYGIDPASLTALGYSNGANTAAAMMLLHPGALRSAILWRAMVTVEDLPQATNPPHARVLLISGRTDPILPLPNAQRLASQLRGREIDVRHEVLNAGHELTRDDIDLARDWLA
jgi:phospholipase/carboxylesterase